VNTPEDNTPEAITPESFMEQSGFSQLDKVPRWWGRESFFDEQVQAVLMEMHPDKIHYNTEQTKGFPVGAWKEADQAAMFLMARKPLGQFMDILIFNPFWASRLLAAVLDYWRRRFDTDKNPETAREKLRRFRELAMLNNSEEQMTEPLTYDHLGAAIYPGSPGAANTIKQALHKENRRREAIMEHWAICWASYLSCGIDGYQKPQNK